MLVWLFRKRLGKTWFSGTFWFASLIIPVIFFAAVGVADRYRANKVSGYAVFDVAIDVLHIDGAVMAGDGAAEVVARGLGVVGAG